MPSHYDVKEVYRLASPEYEHASHDQHPLLSININFTGNCDLISFENFGKCCHTRNGMVYVDYSSMMATLS